MCKGGGDAEAGGGDQHRGDVHHGARMLGRCKAGVNRLQQVRLNDLRCQRWRPASRRRPPFGHRGARAMRRDEPCKAGANGLQPAQKAGVNRGDQHRGVSRVVGRRKARGRALLFMTSGLTGMIQESASDIARLSVLT